MRLASLGADATTLAAVKAAGDELVEAVDRQAEQTDELEARLDEQADTAARERAETKQRVSALEEAAEADEPPTSETAETTTQPDETTPIEDLSQSVRRRGDRHRLGVGQASREPLREPARVGADGAEGNRAPTRRQSAVVACGRP
jgi:hypothetical protein